MAHGVDDIQCFACHVSEMWPASKLSAIMRHIIQATYHIFLNWLHLVRSTILVLRILKTTVLSMLFCKLSSVLRYTQHKLHIDNCVEGKIPEGIFDTAHKTPSAQEVETLRLQLSTYNNFFYWWNTTGCLWMPHVANWDHGHKVWAMPY